MTTSIPEKEIHQAINSVMHPMINCSLVELGIVRNIEIKDNTVKIIFAFPFPNIPIKDYLINAVSSPLIEMGIQVQVAQTVMTSDELERFLGLEKANWKN